MADIPVFCGRMDENPKEYLVAFKRKCMALNFLTEDRWLVILPAFLEGLAQVWYEKQSEATRQSWPRLSAAMVEHFRTEMECENVHQMMANLRQSEGESARRYVDRAAELLDRLTAMQPDSEVFQAGMTTYLLGCLTNGASDEFRLRLKYEEPATMVQAQEIAQKVDVRPEPHARAVPRDGLRFHLGQSGLERGPGFTAGFETGDHLLGRLHIHVAHIRINQHLALVGNAQQRRRVGDDHRDLQGTREDGEVARHPPAHEHDAASRAREGDMIAHGRG